MNMGMGMGMDEMDDNVLQPQQFRSDGNMANTDDSDSTLNAFKSYAKDWLNGVSRFQKTAEAVGVSSSTSKPHEDMCRPVKEKSDCIAAGEAVFDVTQNKDRLCSWCIKPGESSDEGKCIECQDVHKDRYKSYDCFPNGDRCKKLDRENENDVQVDGKAMSKEDLKRKEADERVEMISKSQSKATAGGNGRNRKKEKKKKKERKRNKSRDKRRGRKNAEDDD